MAKTSVRQHILLKSVQRLLPAGEHVRSVVVMTTRHRWLLPYAVVSGLALYGISTASGVQGLTSRLAIMACGTAIAAMATTDYSVLADTTDSFVLCRSSRVRQYAKQLTARLPHDTNLEMVSSTVITSDWRVDGTIYTMTKRWESTMRQLSGRQ